MGGGINFNDGFAAKVDHQKDYNERSWNYTYSDLIEPTPPEPKEKVDPPYSYHLAMMAGGNKIFRYILLSLIFLSNLVVAYVAVRMAGSIEGGYLFLFGNDKTIIVAVLMFLLGIVGIVCIAVSPFYFVNVVKRKIQDYCFVAEELGALFILLPYFTTILMTYLITGSGFVFTNWGRIDYGEAFLRENFYILISAITVGLLSAIVYIIARFVNAKKLKKLLYGDAKIKLSRKNNSPVDVGDSEYLAYQQYLKDCDAYKYSKKGYELQMQRKANGLPFRKIPVWKTKLSLRMKDYLLKIVVACLVVIIAFGSFSFMRFEINTLKLMSLQNVPGIMRDDENFIQKYGDGNNAIELLGEPTVIHDSGDFVKWIYYDRTVSALYQKMEELDQKLKELSAQEKQETEEYFSLLEEEEKLVLQILKVKRFYRIEIEFEKKNSRTH